MKQLKIFAFVLGAGVFASLSANAQKVAAVNVEAIVYSLPEIPQLEEALRKYQIDSIGAEYTQLADEQKRKDSIVKDPKTVKSVKETAEKDLADLNAHLINWQNYAQQLNQEKQSQLLQPLYAKVMEAVKAYAKEKAYTYVLTREAFVIVPDADDITIPVATKLGIKVPAAGAAPAAAPTTPAPAAKTPAAKK